MDDIDRLDKSEVQIVFRLIKLSADFKNTAYVLAFDDNRVARALGERYPGEGDEAGRSFLEKIVQVPLRLPKEDPVVLRQMCFEGVDEAVASAGLTLSEDDVNRFVYLFKEGLQIRLLNPRVGKRYANSLLFSLPLVKNEVDHVDFMLLEGAKAFYPHLYATIRDHPEAYLKYGSPSQDSTWRREILEGGLMGLSSDERKCATAVLGSILPRSVEEGYGDNWERSWADKKRLGSWQYFDRFFSYTVLEDDFSDVELEQIRSAAASGDGDAVERRIRQGVNPRNADRLLFKLDRLTRQLSEDEATVLALGVVRAGDHLPPPQPGSFGGTFRQVSYIVRQCAERLDVSKRRKLAEDVVRQAQPLPMAVQCALGFRHPPTEREAERVLSETEETNVLRLAAARIADDAEGEEPIYERYGQEALTIFWVWSRWGSRDKTSSYIMDTIGTDAKRIGALLRAYAGTVWGGDLGLPTPADFDERNYGQLKDVVDVDSLYNVILRVYGDDLRSPQYDNLQEMEIDERLAHQFSYFYLRNRNSKQT